MMDSHRRGSLWTTLFLVMLPHLTSSMLCPGSCLCNSNGRVECVGNSITGIPQHLPVHTYLLQLNGTSMNVINEQSFANQELLLRFSLTHSHLHTIHPMAFHVAPQFKSVKLSSNDLSTLPDGVFSPLTTLEQLHLDGNQLETIAHMFGGLVKMLDLDLSRNKLRNVASSDFDGLTSLYNLNLGRNSIKKLPPTTFHSLKGLRKLMIYNNELEVLEPGIFDSLVHLQELKLHHNQITSLPPQVFWSLRTLKILTLSSNQLQAIPEKSFYNMPKLSKLTLYNNPLLSLPDQLMGYMPDMTEFYLYDTNLTTVPGNLFANMTGLLRLNFHLNGRLRELPSDLFCCLPKLNKLSLKSNDLHYLHPQLFSRLPKLGTLLLNNNTLQSLPENIFEGLGELWSIDLKNNHLKTLPGDSFLSNTALRALTLSGNPWDCTCGIRAIAKWIRHNEHVVLDRDDVLCHSPVYQLLRTIGSLRDEEFNFCDATTSVSYFTTQSYFPAPKKRFYPISTTRQASAVASRTTPPTVTSTTTQGATQPITILKSTTTPATTRSALHTSIQSTSLQTPTTTLPNEDFLLFPETLSILSKSPPFHNTLVLQQGPEFVHHNLHRGWVYVWFLPSDTTLAGLLMCSHILLIATGLFLIVAAMYCMYRLNKTMDELNAEFA